MNVPPWHHPTPPRRLARPYLECLEDRITPSTHNLSSTGTPWSAGATLAYSHASANPLDIGARKAQPLASPVSPTGGSSSGSGGATPPVPTMFQAWQSLFIDGASLETQRLLYQFVQNIDEFPLGSTLTDSIAKAAASGFDFNAILALNQLLARFTDQFPSSLISDVEFNLQYAGPLGLAVGMAGASAANQAVQIHPAPSPSSD